jgi:hypothetical protein
MYRLALGAVDGHQFPAEKIQVAAEQVKLAEDGLESPGVILPKIRNGLEVGLQLAQQPEHFEFAPAGTLQRPAGADLVEVTPEIKPQQIARRKGRAWYALVSCLPVRRKWAAG